MGIFEFLMLVCFGFSWPFSLAKHLKARTAKGQSLTFLLMVELGYVFGITHKVLNNFSWVTWVYAALLLIVGADIALYFRNRSLDRAEDSARRGGDGSPAAGPRDARSMP